MVSHSLTLLPLAGRWAVCQLDPASAPPPWAFEGSFISITRTPDELSVVCAASTVPHAIRADRGWIGWRVAGTQDFSLVGVLASLTTPLAQAGVSLFAVSTFDTDYLLVKEADHDRAVAAFIAAGHHVGEPDAPAVGS